MLLGWPENPSACWRISSWGPENCILHQMIPRWLHTRGSSRFLSLLLSTMRCNAIVLSNGHIHQLIKTVGADNIKTLLELGIKTMTETIMLLGISVCMMTGILTQVIKDLYILKHGAGSLCKRQEFVQLPIHESLGNMMRSESGPKFIPIDNIIDGQRGTIIIPPDAGGAT